MDIEAQLKAIKRGAAEIITEDELIAKLKQAQLQKRPLRVKLGLDPTAPDIHLGFAVVLRKLKLFQDLGHEIIVIIGDFTGRIGDPSGMSEMRKQLTEEEIKANAQTYQEQLSKILDPSKMRIVFNSQWLSQMDFADVIQLASKYTLARTLERDDFQQRYKENKPIGLHEILYPLCQGYDSIAINADIEMGGMDQKFNILVGRELQSRYGQDRQVAILMPLLVGLDGVQKMSKSLGNYIGITEDPDVMYEKLMRVPDELLIQYFTLGTDISEEEIQIKQESLQTNTLDPYDAHHELAFEIVKMYHGVGAAREAEETYKARAGVTYIKEIPKEKIRPKEIEIPAEMLKDGKIWICKLLVFAGLAKSHSVARRLIQQGAVEVEGKRLTNFSLDLVIKEGMLLKVGKRKFALLRLT